MSKKLLKNHKKLLIPAVLNHRRRGVSGHSHAKSGHIVVQIASNVSAVHGAIPGAIHRTQQIGPFLTSAKLLSCFECSMIRLRLGISVSIDNARDVPKPIALLK